MKKFLLMFIISLMFIVTDASAKDSEPTTLDGIKEAAKGVAWMAKTQLCLFTYAIWGWTGLYHCQHPEHWDSIKSIEKK